MKKIINTKNAPSAIGPYSQAVWAGDMLLMSGQIALNPETGAMENESLASETHRVMKNIAGLLEAAGMDYSNILKASIFIKDMNEFKIKYMKQKDAKTITKKFNDYFTKSHYDMIKL
jgi:2-iminobutanoate/2-iminopropanoate deaminase